MATRKEIQSALQHPYDRMLFSKQVLHPVFGSSFKLLESVQKPFVEPTKSETSVISQVLIYGTITLEDGTDITCYEVTLQPTVRIEQSKVAIQQYVRKLLISGQAALINFIAPKDKDIWRFTLVAKDSKITNEGIAETQTHPQRYTYLVEKDRPNRTMAERLETLSLESEINLEKLIKAFSVEAMSKAFFDEYKEHYQNFVEYLTGKRMVKQGGKWVEKQTGKASPFLVSLFNGNEKDARDFIKKLMGRIVFLYFVQKKRWLGASTKDYNDGPYDFIFKLFDQTGGDERFFPVGLSELFFNALNKERKDDDWKMPSGKVVKIPYLNGGLFVRDEIDEKIHKKGDLLTFPPGLFSHIDKMDTPNDRGFLDFLNAYNFTVYEDSQDDHTVAVDPEMLGHIFENLLEDNKDKGAFYTPKEIVHYMCQESLIEYLATNLAKEYKVYRQLDDDQVELLGNETRIGQLKMIEELGDKALNRKEVEHIVKEKDIKNLSSDQLQRIDELLDSVKICDPAIGSGAFPMGLLQEIFSIKEASAYLLDKPFNAARTKENIISNSIYGVDIERGAVDIARLRFWLSLVVDEEKPKALPNLDYKIVVGNSLLSKFEEEIIEIDWEIEEGKQFDMFGNQHEQQREYLLNEITKKQRDFFDPEYNGNKLQLKREIRNLKIDILINQLELMRIANGQNEMPKKGVNETPSSYTKRLNAHLENHGWGKLILKLLALKEKSETEFYHFDWKLDFPEILNPTLVKETGGFDIVIANPPYIGQKGNNHLFQPIKESSGLSMFHQRRMDYFYFFFHLAINITKNSGVINFITTNYYISATSADKLRKDMKERTSFLSFINFNELKIFSSALGQHNSITTLKKGNFKNSVLSVDVTESGSANANILGQILNYTSKNSNYTTLPQDEIFEDSSSLTIRFNSSSNNNSSESFLNNWAKVHKRLSEVCDLTQGIVTGADKLSKSHISKYNIDAVKGSGIFVLSDDELKSLDLAINDHDFIKPFFKNSDVYRWSSAEHSQQHIIYYTSKTSSQVSPVLLSHFEKYKKLLINRNTRSGTPILTESDYTQFVKGQMDVSYVMIASAFRRGEYYCISYARESNYFEEPKIVVPQRSPRNTFGFSDKPWYAASDVHFIITRDSNYLLKYILAILNSKVIYTWLFYRGKRKGNNLELVLTPLSNIPICFSDMTIQERISTISDYLIFLSTHNHVQSELYDFFEDLSNAAIYELYFKAEFEKCVKSILEHLKDLPAISKEMTEEEKLRVCENVYNQLNDPSHPLRKNLDTLNEIPEVAIIEGINQKYWMQN